MEKMRNDAIKNIDALIQKVGLNPNVKKYFEQGKVYYSYFTACGFWGSIDPNDNDERYPKLVEECEKEHNCLVYHVIESGYLLAMLFVQPKYANRLKGRRITAIVYNLRDPGYHEMGEIVLGAENGALAMCC